VERGRAARGQGSFGARGVFVPAGAGYARRCRGVRTAGTPWRLATGRRPKAWSLARALQVTRAHYRGGAMATLGLTTPTLAGKVAMQPAIEQGAAGASPSRATRPHREIPTTMMMMWTKTKRTKTSLTDRRSVCEPDEN